MASLFGFFLLLFVLTMIGFFYFERKKQQMLKFVTQKEKNSIDKFRSKH